MNARVRNHSDPGDLTHVQHRVVSGGGAELTVNQGLLNLSLVSHNCIGVISVFVFPLKNDGLTKWSILVHWLVQGLSGNKDTLSIILGSLKLDAGLIRSG